MTSHDDGQGSPPPGTLGWHPWFHTVSACSSNKIDRSIDDQLSRRHCGWHITRKGGNDDSEAQQSYIEVTK